MLSLPQACNSSLAFAAHRRQPAALFGDVQKFTLFSGISSSKLAHAVQAKRTCFRKLWSAGKCSANNRLTKIRRLSCLCAKSQDTQPGISRQALKAALQEAAQIERGYLTKLLIISAIGAAGVKFGSLLISTPFQPSGIIALSIITIPCLMLSALLLTRQGE